MISPPISRVDRVPFLPQELGGAQEQPRPELPADHVAPLVQEQRQVAVALDPLREHRVDDRLRRRTHDERLLQGRAGIGLHRPRAPLPRRPQPRVGHDRHFLRESLHVLGLAREKALGDKQREVSVLVPRRLEHGVQGALHELPHAVAEGPDDHATAHGRVIGQLRLLDDVGIPLAEVLRAWRDLLRLRGRHYLKIPLRTLVSGTFFWRPVLRSRTMATFAFRSSGPRISALGAPRGAASSSCFLIDCSCSAYSTDTPRVRSSAASCTTGATSSPPTATKKASSSAGASTSLPCSFKSSPRTTSPMPKPTQGRSIPATCSIRSSYLPPPQIARSELLASNSSNTMPV